LSAVAAGDGYVAGKVKVSGTGVGVQNDLAVYYVAPGQEPQLALREGDPIPGVTESALLQELNEILLDDSGTLYIRGYVQVPGESELLYFVIKGTPGAWELLAITGQSYGADRKMTGIGVIAINHSGDLIMFGTTELVEPVNNSRMNFGHIWKERPEPGENEILATEKVGYGFLGSGEVFKGFDEIAINDLGTIFVSCSINFEKAFVVGSGNNFSVIARQNSPAPDGNIYDNVPLSGNFSYFPGDKDAFGIKAWVDIEDPDRKQFNERLFVYQNGGTTVSHTYEEGKSYTGIGGEMIDSVQSISVYSDRHFLRGITEGKTGYWLVDSQVQKIAAVGDSPAYSPDGVFSAVGGPFIGRTGQIAYQATAASFPGVYVQGVDGEFAMAAGRNVEVRLKNDQIRALVRGYTMGNSSAMDGRFPIVVWALGSITHIAMVDPNQLGQPSPGISGKVFEDADYSGDLSEDDRGLPNVEVELFLDDGTGGEAIRSQFTLTDGSYAFDELQDGNYLVRITPMEDYTPTWDTTDPLDDGLISVAY
ncbi:MAG: hypothetical protein KJT03_21215, partial [Verrucomicrobiae bacterium]|nr:hypothetical protein [Verrucomicrobiae bacterium]